MKQIIILALLLFLFSESTCNASWLIFHKPTFKGKIVDIDTNEPIEGAVVIAVYRVEAISIADSVDISFDARETLTDKNGKFKIPSYTTLIQPLSWSIPTQFIIFKPGYACAAPLHLEDEFSGRGRGPDNDFNAWGHHGITHIIQKSGIVKLRKVSGNDRFESYRNFYLPHNANSKLTAAREIQHKESTYILQLEKQLRANNNASQNIEYLEKQTEDKRNIPLPAIPPASSASTPAIIIPYQEGGIPKSDVTVIMLPKNPQRINK